MSWIKGYDRAEREHLEQPDDPKIVDPCEICHKHEAIIRNGDDYVCQFCDRELENIKAEEEE